MSAPPAVAVRRGVGRGTLELALGDITRDPAEALVNAANERLAGGGGVDGAIHRAGGPSIMEETDETYPHGCPTGSAVLSRGGNLPAKYVVHAVGPVWGGGTNREAELLAGAVRRSLELAQSAGCRSVAVPAISCGVYGYPPDLAAGVILDALRTYLLETSEPLTVRMVLFSEPLLAQFTRALEAVDGA